VVHSKKGKANMFREGRNCHQAAYLRGAPRSKIWRKVQVRLAFLGWNTVDLMRELNPGWDDFSGSQKATARAVFGRKLNRSTFKEPEYRQLESALGLEEDILRSNRVGFARLVK
tara:strand:- start:229 stop:570 length:342 start_codon:yes stop_codon:yes gene_type:complete